MYKLHEFIQLAGDNNSIQSIQGGLHSLHKTYTKLDGQYPIPPGQRVENRLEQVVSQEMPRWNVEGGTHIKICEVLLHITGSYIQSLGMELDGRWYERKNIYTYTHTHTHIYICTHTHTHTHTHTSIVDSLMSIQGSAHVVVVYVLMTNTILIYKAYILLYYWFLYGHKWNPRASCWIIIPRLKINFGIIVNINRGNTLLSNSASCYLSSIHFQDEWNFRWK